VVYIINIKAYIYAVGTPEKVFYPRIEGYKPKGWNWRKSDYQVNLIIQYTGIADESPPKEIILYRKHKRYTLKNKIHSGRKANLQKAIEQTFTKRLEKWSNIEFKKISNEFKAKGKSLGEFSYDIVKFVIYRLGDSTTTKQIRKRFRVRKEKKKGYKSENLTKFK